MAGCRTPTRCSTRCCSCSAIATATSSSWATPTKPSTAGAEPTSATRASSTATSALSTAPTPRPRRCPPRPLRASPSCAARWAWRRAPSARRARMAPWRARVCACASSSTIARSRPCWTHRWRCWRPPTPTAPARSCGWCRPTPTPRPSRLQQMWRSCFPTQAWWPTRRRSARLPGQSRWWRWRMRRQRRSTLSRPCSADRRWRRPVRTKPRWRCSTARTRSRCRSSASSSGRASSTRWCRRALSSSVGRCATRWPTCSSL